MDNIKVPVEVNPDEDTEWNDILRSHGIIPERPPSPTAELEAALDEAVKRQHENRLESKDLDELDALEDEEDEEFLNFYKNKRMQELKKLADKKKFGSVMPISKNEYESEVTKASNESFVLIHLSLQSSLQSRLLSSILVTLAQKFPEIKFCEIPANRCIENYPESNCPTLIIYHKTAVLKQFITLTQLGGNDTKVKDLESVLVDLQAVEMHDKRLVSNQQDEDLEEERKFRFVKKSVRGRTNDDEDDDEDDFYD
ncbi:thioredoxin-like protein [Suhomyces tanzawaensis NRRL Y-17324]|uniref:Thioredoxin-like protein n=1 Tax=Suhomyces tanzawaensis NRRL Y-17324 TaxID=984487 RepID=A0A1E4SSD8_9ASCO|nr:thioredoxin-like protein [Suhomyces tanzawaensis NRRL Y-17324]ODV82428.1 thioredoxin-like protein [Suhomyces tanzawaensis NRRL Y-17324]